MFDGIKDTAVSKVVSRMKQKLPSFSTWIPHAGSGWSGVLQKSCFTFIPSLTWGTVHLFVSYVVNLSNH